MTSIGVDIIEVERIESAIRQWGERFLNRIYTEVELKICQDRASSLAARFAAKEAVMKVLGTGTRGIGWKEIEILSDGLGKPLVKLYGKAKSKAEETPAIPVKGSASISPPNRVTKVIKIIPPPIADTAKNFK